MSRTVRTTIITISAVACLALALARVWLAAVQPLWFDEAWSLMVATTPDWRSFAHEAWVDVNPPLYYLLLHLWTAVAGASDLALRLPGLLSVAAAAAIPLARKPVGLSLESRLGFAAMLFAWWGVDIFLAARGYGLLLALSVVQTLLFAELLRKPGRRAALAWAAVGALAILTHYYALIVTAVQGLAFLAVCRRQALRTWPAALAFAPAVGWIAWHAPRLAQFAAPKVAWHAALSPAQAMAMGGFTVNPSAPALGLLSAAAVGAAFLIVGRREAAQPSHLWVAATVSLIALGLTLASGVWRPSLTARYLIPTAPGLLLGLVLCAQGLPRPKLAVSALALAWLATALWPAALAVGRAPLSPYAFETASHVLMRQKVTDVVFAWDHEATQIMPADTLQRLGSVFFRRAGVSVRVHPLVIRPTDDVNALALAAASGRRPGIIWIYNRAGRTAASTHPPDIPARDPRWSCQRVGDATVGSLACWRR